jgi:hypothetical protein
MGNVPVNGMDVRGDVTVAVDASSFVAKMTRCIQVAILTLDPGTNNKTVSGRRGVRLIEMRLMMVMVRGMERGR